MEKQFKEFIKTKSRCLPQKKPPHIPYTFLGKITSSAPVNFVATEFLKIDTYSRVHKHMLVMINFFQRYKDMLHETNLLEL